MTLQALYNGRMERRKKKGKAKKGARVFKAQVFKRDRSAVDYYGARGFQLGNR